MLSRFTLLGLVNVDSLGYDSGFGVPLADEVELSKNMDLALTREASAKSW